MTSTDENVSDPAWHYDYFRNEYRLDPRDIENQGRFLLYRGLNIRRIVAFLGSGVSQAYGRTSWSELALVALDGVDAALEGCTAADQRPICQMVNRLRDLRPSVARGASDALPVAMHLIERIFLMASQTLFGLKLQEARKKFKNEKARLTDNDKQTAEPIERLIDEFGLGSHFDALCHKGFSGPKLGRRLFRRLIREETYDETAYVRRLFSDSSNCASETKDAAHTKAEKLRHDHLDRFRRNLNYGNVRKWIELGFLDNSENWREHLTKTESNLKKRSDSSHGGASTPQGGLEGALAALVSRLIGLSLGGLECQADRPAGARYWHLWALALDCARVGKCLAQPDDQTFSEAHKQLSDFIEHALKKSTSTGDSSGRSLSKRVDPLIYLAYDLGIKRFATLNYDLEIERMLSDLGFRPTDYPEQKHLLDPDVERIGPMGGRARDFVVTEDTIADFIDFGLQISPYDFQVAHLHGRATDDDNIVVTERDYQKAYVGDTPVNDAFDAGFKILFGSNPILFIGFGMSEGDVMRPLRYFAAGSTRRNPAIIALRDARGSKAEIDRFVAEQYVRHGAIVLHYGYAKILNDSSGDPKETEWQKEYTKRYAISDAQREDFARRGGGRRGNAQCEYASWLHHVNEIGNGLKVIFENLYLAADEKDIEKRLTFERAIESWRHDVREHMRALKFLLGGKPGQDFESDGASSNVKTEYGTLDAFREFVDGLHTSKSIHELSFLLLPHDGEKATRVKYLFKTVLPRNIDRTVAAAMTVALCARLESLRNEWTHWWDDWREPIPSRAVDPTRRQIPKFVWPTCDRTALNGQSFTKEQAFAIDSLYSNRHARHVVLTDTDISQPSPFLSAFLKSIPALAPNTSTSRLFLIVSPRGSGTGSNLSELPRHADRFLGDWSESHDSSARTRRRRYAGFFIANFSTAPNVENVWDDLIAFFNSHWEEKTEVFVSNESGARKSGRVAQLRQALRQLDARLQDAKTRLQGIFDQAGHTTTQIEARYLLVLHGLQHLFDPDGRPKNASVREICDLLFEGPATTGLDIVVMLEDKAIPDYFRSSADRGRGASPGSERAFTLILSGEDLTDEEDPAHPLRPKRSRKRQNYIVDLIDRNNILLSARQRTTVEGNLAPEFATTIGALQAENSRFRETTNLLRIVHEVYPSDLHSETQRDLLKKLTKQISERGGNETGDRDEWTSEDQRVLEKFLEAYLGESRYALLVMLAIFEDAQKRGDTNKFVDFVKALRNHPLGRTEGPGDHFYELVLDHWWSQVKWRANKTISALRDAHFVAEASCADEQIFKPISICKRICKAANDPLLHQEILRDIAIIAGPANADTLLGSPNIVASCRRLLQMGKCFSDEERAAGQKQFESLIVTALCVLWKRRLIFMLYPEGDKSNRKLRFVVHRSMQRYVFRKLGAQESEPPRDYSYGVSIYASQRSELPQLSANGYSFLNELVDGLAEFPSRRGRRDDVAMHKDHAKSSRLRAALGICKTLYSIGVVSRFADLPGLERPAPPKIGYFEHHRLTMRWLLQKAKNIQDKENKKNNPFYRDEIVWLLNECGVFSLAQGQIYDAVAMFRSARIRARAIDGSKSGALERRIMLNSGLANLEHGRIALAESEFGSVEQHRDEDPVHRCIAAGYLGLISHLHGNLDDAEERYSKAICELSKRKHLRSASIFFRHRGSLRQHRGLIDKARGDFAESIKMAAAGGFEDVLWLALLDEANLEISSLAQHPERLHHVIGELNVLKTLDGAHHYSDKMDVPRLACHVSAVRAKLLSIQGETSRAAEIATRALRIATLNGLVLRSITYRIQLASILRMGGLQQQSERVRLQTFSAARRVGLRLLAESAR